MPATQPIVPGLGPGVALPAGKPVQAQATGPAFADVLAGRVDSSGSVRFSGHALERLQRRGINMDAATLDRLNGGVARAAAKGSRDSLVLLDDTAFVVSVKNKTVVTAVDREHMKEQVFTNIDSAVIA